MKLHTTNSFKLYDSYIVTIPNKTASNPFQDPCRHEALETPPGPALIWILVVGKLEGRVRPGVQGEFAGFEGLGAFGLGLSLGLRRFL